MSVSAQPVFATRDRTVTVRLPSGESLSLSVSNPGVTVAVPGGPSRSLTWGQLSRFVATGDIAPPCRYLLAVDGEQVGPLYDDAKNAHFDAAYHRAGGHRAEVIRVPAGE